MTGELIGRGVLIVTGDAEEARGHGLTAGAYYLRAAVYYFCGERFIAPSERKWATYRDCLRCFEKGVARRYPDIERVEVPYEGQALPARFLKADVAGPAPAVVMFDGLDNAKELSVLFGGVEIARRGIHVLAIDGPGQGEALRLRGIPSRYDYEVPARAALDCIAQRPEVDARRVAVMGFSMGGYYAPRAAAMEPRFAAVRGVGRPLGLPRGLGAPPPHHGVGSGTKLSAPSFQLP